jgi:hypothetical protein
MGGMTQRKPPGVPVEDWVERQIAAAQERGDFDDLPGAGKPLQDLDRPMTALDWAVRWARREEADLSAALPPSLALPRERREILGALPELASEAAVREVVADFNQRLDQAYRRPPQGPYVALAFLDLERCLQVWRAAHPAPPPPPPPPPAPPRRRWGMRRR